jgi:hypothetical protein
MVAPSPVVRALLNRAAVSASIVRAAAVVLLIVFGCSSESVSTAHRELTRRPVLATTRRTTTTLVELHTETEKLVTTPEHPFAARAGWTRAADLKLGDTIQTASGTARVLGVQRRQVPPTDVYNLSIAKTHSYFAGQSALLVHNVDCVPSKTLAELLAEERHAEQLERDVRERRIRRLLEAHRRQQNRLTLNDAPDTPNCGYCSVAALNDAKTVSDFVREHGLDQSNPLHDKELRELLNVLGLSHAETGAPMVFRKLTLARRFERMIKQGKDRNDIDLESARLGQLPEPRAREYMESLPGNTSMVIYRWVESIEEPPGSGKFRVEIGSHAVTAVRTTSGQIVYIDFQDVPPRIYASLPKTTFDAVVLPTDVDWRYNRQLYAALRDGKLSPSL